MKSLTPGSWDMEQNSQTARVMKSNSSLTKQLSVSPTVVPPVTENPLDDSDAHALDPKPVVNLNLALSDADQLSKATASTDPAIFKPSDGNKSGLAGSTDPKDTESSATGQENLAISHPLGKNAKRRRRKAKLHKMKYEANAQSCELTSRKVADASH